VSAQEAKPASARVVFGSEFEALVRLLEDTPRERLLERVGEKIRAGTSYQELLTAVMLAGVRGIQPRPVGFKFHAVLVIHSAHLASLASSEADRWLPLLWSLDQFKSSQQQNTRQGNWSMAALPEGTLPPGSQSRGRFVEAMDRWDEAGADVAIGSLARSAGLAELEELFWRYGARDFRDIGHKAIYVANAFRTLHTIGRQHAEPVLRSVAYALLQRGRVNPADADEEADRPWRENLTRVRAIRPEWKGNPASPHRAKELLAVLREGSHADASETVVRMLNQGVGAQTAWDAVLLGAGELLMRQPGLVGIHCVTTANALHHAFQASGNDETRLLMLLQGAAFMTMFRKSMEAGKPLPPQPIEALEATPGGLEEILAGLPGERTTAAQKTLGFLNAGGDARALMAAARRLIFLKGTNAHDYKFSSAALEDFSAAHPAWRNRLLATAMFNLRGSGERDNPLAARVRAALSGA
jgi:hypothetical protein